MKSTSIVAFLSLALFSVAPARAETLQWTRQLGTSSGDRSLGVSADGFGNVYISGWTRGSLEGTNAGGDDAFVSKYDASGTLQWTRQLGTSSDDRSIGVSADGLGSVYISGWTEGSLGGTGAGSSDAFLSKYDASGTLQWTRQLGTSEYDSGMGVSADELGNVYISGVTEGNLGGTGAGISDAFLSKYDASGTLQWTRQLGTSSGDRSLGVSADGMGDVYISGVTVGSLGGTGAGSSDAFLSKYDASGTLLWTRQLGTSNWDQSNGVSADGLGSAYITGVTEGSLGKTNAGSWDTFLSKYDASGTLVWVRQLGTSSSDFSCGVSADGLGNVYISGDIHGSLGRHRYDTFLSKYDASGTLVWTRQIGTNGDEETRGVSADGLGNVYISGSIHGNLGGTNVGGDDVFVAKFNTEMSEPGGVVFGNDVFGDQIQH